MQNNKKKHGAAARYATAAIVLGGGAIAGVAAVNYLTPQNYGVPFEYEDQQYYIQDDSRRVVYPSREVCLSDVPADKQDECEPVSDYYGTAHRHYGYWYGPVYSPRDNSDYRPKSQYASEPATPSNFGKKFPTTANTSGFGATGKALSSDSGGS